MITGTASSSLGGRLPEVVLKKICLIFNSSDTTQRLKKKKSLAKKLYFWISVFCNRALTMLAIMKFYIPL